MINSSTWKRHTKRISPEKPKGASINLWYKEKEHIWILTGRESRYLRERKTLFPDPKIITQYETFDGTSLEEAKKYFKQKAKELESLYSDELERHGFQDKTNEIRYDNPIIYHDHIKVVFRFSNSDCPFGIIKGNYEVEDSTTKNTIIRETQEEVGFDLKKDKLHHLKSNCDYDIFHYEMKEDEKQIILKELKKRKKEKHGELFDLFFQKIDDSFLSQLKKPKWNQKSICSIQHFLSNIHSSKSVRHGGGISKSKRKDKKLSSNTRKMKRNQNNLYFR
jgi:diadenosine tetraphosphate (Ap4A) HIT family hydrolase